MKIGIDARPLEGNRTGVGRILINLLSQWSKNTGHEFVLYFKAALPQDDFLQKPPFVLKVLPKVWGRESNLLFEQVALPRACEQDRVDVLYAPAYSGPIFGKVPLVITIHDISYDVHPEWFPPVNRFVRQWPSRWSAKKASKIIAVSDFTKSEVSKHYHIPAEKIARIYQPGFVDAKLLKEPTREFPKPTDKYALFVGDFYQRRHVVELLRALVKVNQTLAYDLVLVGVDRTYPAQNIEKVIEKTNNLIGRTAVYHQQSISDEYLSYLYRHANCVILPSEYEGFGMPVLEGMSLGVPLLIGPGSSLEEVADGAALVTEPSNPDKIASDILQLINNQDLKQKLIIAGSHRAAFFSFPEAAEQTLEVLTNAK